MPSLVLVLAASSAVVGVALGRTHGWDTTAGQLWADFGHPVLLDPDVIEFIADHYQIISLEKCLAGSDPAYRGDTEAAFAVTAAAIKAANQSASVIFYFSGDLAYSDCYVSGKTYLSHPEWWAREDNGVVINASSSFPYRHFYNHSIVDERNWWMSVTQGLAVTNGTFNGMVDGVFMDGSGWDQHDGVSFSRESVLTNGSWEASSELSAFFHSAAGSGKASLPETFVGVIGNGLMEYAIPPYTHNFDMLPYMDGACVEHMAAFEVVNSDGSLDLDLMNDLISMILKASRPPLNKTLLLKHWPGPVSTPIGPFGPTWANGSAPDTYDGRAAAAADWFPFAHALYLAVASETTFFSYAWWYDVNDGYFPCQHPNGSCSAPASWYPDLDRPLGQPLNDLPAAWVKDGPSPSGSLPSVVEWRERSKSSDMTTHWSGQTLRRVAENATRSTAVYTREYEHASVYVDLSTWTGTISWSSD